MHLPILTLLTLLDLMVASSGDLQQQYIGCFKDSASNNRVMGNQYTGGSMTLEMCWQRCKQTMNSFFGVEFWYECYCGDKFDTLGRAENCDTPCGGNYAQICGGNGTLSVYSVCPSGRYHKECIETCNCQNHTTYGERCWINGTCPAGCKSGWTGKGCGTYIDECATQNGGCQHLCHNIVGSYNCSCLPGYTLNGDGRTCDDIDECAVNNGNCSQVCINTHGNYSCYCWPGYNGTDRYNKMCMDINECVSFNGGCQQRCHNTAGNYQCSCESGYALNSNMRTCDDVDECAANNGGCEMTCVNLPAGNVTCECPGTNWKNEPGYVLHSDGKRCENVNECETDNGGCERVCHDTKGNFECRGDETDAAWPVGAKATVAVLTGSLVVVSILFLVHIRRKSNSPTSSKVTFSRTEKEAIPGSKQLYENVEPLKQSDSIEPSTHYLSLELAGVGVDEATYQQIESCDIPSGSTVTLK